MMVKLAGFNAEEKKVKLFLNVMMLTMVFFANLSLAQDQTFRGTCASDSRLQKAANIVLETITGENGATPKFGIKFEYSIGAKKKILSIYDPAEYQFSEHEGFKVKEIKTQDVAGQCSVIISVTTLDEKNSLNYLLSIRKLSSVIVNERFLVNIVAVFK